ncbi:casein kinase 2 regulatory subunit [Coemansia nantahalensis]|uniref:Casein kinase 2 regulatory subunit n=2 Tax=Coemansia TaxID=4863 RepID=A0ACC1L9A5_9FUNG|nr:casein kinase 2 regulatory subunit [Coemansia nantahalensis]KAJ2769804.1 casein kinase 2 regulatory subunit [Coemansia nantahalensis]KAJ2803054.1 casein kinase 2 regulatory subunit [Coemansia helicoidea]
MADTPDSAREGSPGQDADALAGDLRGSEYHSGLDNTESEFDDEPYASDDTANLTWIAWFCSFKGHEYFCEVEEEFIEDDFNLTGLNQNVNYYMEALEMILEMDDDNDDPLDADEVEAIEGSAEVLYGMIHARYILTRNGLHQMADKYENGDFGVCPRYACNGTCVIPCGRTDVPERDSVKLFCPSCLDIYSPPSSRYQKIDGSYFGTSFPHIFFQAFPSYIPTTHAPIYKPLIYGFAISERSKAGPRMQWLRMRPEADASDAGYDDSVDSQSFVEAPDAAAPPEHAAPEHGAGGRGTGLGAGLGAGPGAGPSNAAAPSDGPGEGMDTGTDKAATSCASTPAPAADAVSPAVAPSSEARRKDSTASAAPAIAAA